MKNNNGLIIGSGFAASLLAFGVTSGVITFKDASIASLLAAPAALITHIVTDSKAQKRVRELDSKLSKALRNLETAQQSVSKLEDLENKVYYLNLSLEETKKALDLAVVEHEKAYKLNQVMREEKGVLAGQVAAFKSEIEQLQLEIEEWEEQFSDRVEVAADAKFQVAKKAEIQKIFDEHDAITSQAMQLFQELQQWGQKVAHGHQTKREIIQNLARSYNENLLEFGETVKKEHAAYVSQIEILNERVGQLQHQLNGELIEPEYLPVAYSIEGRIANDIAKEVFSALQIPLAVKGYHAKPDGSTEVGYGFSRSMGSVALVDVLKRQSETIAKSLRIHKITGVRQLEIASNMIVLTFRREPTLKDDGAKLLAGTADEFIKYVVSHPIRYRLIADPGVGKTPTTAVMLSSILKEGCRRGNTPRGKKVPHTLVSVSYPGAMSSLKDSDYPLERFLKYGTTTAAIKSFQDALEDWQYRQQNIKFAEEFFHIRVWDELDNTINSADDPMKLSEALKKVLKQGGHSNIGWIVSGQSVMTSQIKGFKDDDRSLFTEIIIGIPKIRMYVKKYARGKNSDANLAKLERNLDDLEAYIESVNDRITDDARLLRIALIVDEKSPKLYFLPNLDNVNFDKVSISESEKKATDIILGRTAGTGGTGSVTNSSNTVIVSNAENLPFLPKPTMQGFAICPHCGSYDLSLHKGERYYCKECKKKFAASKVVFK
jgi:hypothetical protein